MGSFSGFFTVLLASLFFASISRKVHFPWVIALILAGITIGPHGLDLVTVDPTVEFISETGLVLLMFMAGLEAPLSSFKGVQTKLLFLSFINGFIPFLVGLGISLAFGYPLQTGILMGIIFVSSSVAVIVPALESHGLIKTPLGSSVLATSIVQDIASLILLSVFLQSEDSLAHIPLIVFYPMILLVLSLIRYFLPKLQKFILHNASDEEDFFHRDVRAILLVLFGTVIIFELLGLHAIIAGFFAGLVLSESIDSEVLRGKIRAISYGIFIPTFFIVVGTKTDINLFLQAGTTAILTLTIIVGSVLSKLASGTIGARLVGFNLPQSVFFGATSVPQLSTTLAAAFTALSLGALTNELVTAMVALSIVTTTLSPILISILENHILTKTDIKAKV